MIWIMGKYEVKLRENSRNFEMTIVETLGRITAKYSGPNKMRKSVPTHSSG